MTQHYAAIVPPIIANLVSPLLLRDCKSSRSTKHLQRRTATPPTADFERRVEDRHSASSPANGALSAEITVRQALEQFGPVNYEPGW